MFESITYVSLTKSMFIISDCFQAREERGRIQDSFLGLDLGTEGHVAIHEFKWLSM